MKKLIAFQILIALAVGAVIGHFFPDFGMALRPVGDGFIRLIKMIVVPIVFSTIVIGAAGSGSMKKMGSLGIKTIIWFEVITTLVLGLGLLLANVLKPGVGLDLSHLAKKDIHELSGYTDKVVDFKQMILDIIPTNIIDVMARNDLLAVIFFAILFGVAAAGIGKASFWCTDRYTGHLYKHRFYHSVFGCLSYSGSERNRLDTSLPQLPCRIMGIRLSRDSDFVIRILCSNWKLLLWRNQYRLFEQKQKTDFCLPYRRAGNDRVWLCCQSPARLGSC